MKREYTLLILGALTASLQWVGLTTSLRQIVFTLIGLWLIVIAYRYRNEKASGKIQINEVVKNETPLPEPKVAKDPQITETENPQNLYERKQTTKPRI